MTISSRTPEGDWFQCEICRKQFCIEAATFPSPEAVCPHCGCLQFVGVESGSRPLAHQIPDQNWKRLNTLVEAVGYLFWIAWSLGTSLVIYLTDTSLISSLVWFAAILLYGLWLLPQIESRSYESPDTGIHFWRSVAVGWALGSGIPVGVLFGALFASAGYLDVSANSGAFLGLLIGLVFASVQGLVCAWVIDCFVRRWFGMSLADVRSNKQVGK
ncbi:MAG: hypothetical protein AAF394_03760 [Planctomycetota bacterium]